MPPDSNMFMPFGDAGEQTLGLMALAISNGAPIVDDETGEPAGDLAPFIRSGLLDESKPQPLSVLKRVRSPLPSLLPGHGRGG